MEIIYSHTAYMLIIVAAVFGFFMAYGVGANERGQRYGNLSWL